MQETAAAIREQISEFISKTFPIARQRQVGPDEQLMENGIIDSLGFLEIITFIERNYKFQVKDEDVTAENFNSIANICSYIERTLAQA